jgi:hypothetical protein
MLDAEVKRRNKAETEEWRRHTRGDVIRGAVKFICSEEGQAIHRRLTEESDRRLTELVKALQARRRERLRRQSR